MPVNLNDVKIAILLKTTRSILCWTQERLGQELGSPKTTIARAETAEGGLHFSTMFDLQKLWSKAGISFDFKDDDEIQISIKKEALIWVQQELSDPNNKRSDKKIKTELSTVEENN